MRVEFFHPDDPNQVVGVAIWDGRRVQIQADAADHRATLTRVFRASAVAVDDPSLRPGGTSGVAVVAPGDIKWFRAAATVRGKKEGLGARFVTDRPGGWDPALDPQTYGWAGRKG